MANEIEVMIDLILNRPSASQRLQRKFSRTKFDQTGTNWVHITQNITQAANGEALSVTDIGTLGWALFYNNGTAAGDWIEVGDVPVATLIPVLRIEPGEFAVCRLSASITTLTAQTAVGASAAMDLEYWLIED